MTDLFFCKSDHSTSENSSVPLKVTSVKAQADHQDPVLVADDCRQSDNC